MAYTANTYRDPYASLGSALGNIGQAFLSGPSPVEQDRLAADAAYKNTMGQKAAAEFDVLKAQVDARGQFGPLFSRFLAGDTSVAGQVADLGLKAGYKPEDLGAAGLFTTAYGGGDEAALRRAGAASGKALGVNDAYTLAGSQDIRDQNAANDQRQAFGVAGINADSAARVAGINNEGAMSRLEWETRNKPITTGAGEISSLMQDGRPVMQIAGMPTESTAKASVIQDLATGGEVPAPAQAVVGAMGEAPNPLDPQKGPQAGDAKNYRTPDGQGGTTFDGLTDAVSKQPLPQGTLLYSGNVQTDNPTSLSAGDAARVVDRSDNVLYTTGRLKQLVSGTNIGVAGTAQSVVNGLANQAGAVLSLIGSNPAQIEQNLGISVDPASPPDLTVFNDPTLGPVNMLTISLAYAMAGLNDPSGRVSDADFKAALRSIQAGPLAYKDGFLATINEIELLAQNRKQRALGSAGAPPQPGVPQPETSGQLAAPAAPATPRIRIDLDGNPIQ